MEWTGVRYADGPTMEVSIWIDAAPEQVWELASDVELMTTMSAELQAVEWLDAAPGPAVGARFVGHNRRGDFAWSTTSYIIECDPGRVFAWAVTNPAVPSAVWRFHLAPKGGGTELSQWVQIGPGPSNLSFVIQSMPNMEQEIVFARLQELERAMIVTLQCIKRLAEV